MQGAPELSTTGELRPVSVKFPGGEKEEVGTSRPFPPRHLASPPLRECNAIGMDKDTHTHILFARPYRGKMATNQKWFSEAASLKLVGENCLFAPPGDLDAQRSFFNTTQPTGLD